MFHEKGTARQEEYVCKLIFPKEEKEFGPSKRKGVLKNDDDTWDEDRVRSPRGVARSDGDHGLNARRQTTTRSPRAARWIVEKRSRGNVWKQMASPMRTKSYSSSAFTPVSMAAGAVRRQTPQLTTSKSAKNEHISAIKRIQQKMKTASVRLGFSDGEEDVNHAASPLGLSHVSKPAGVILPRSPDKFDFVKRHLYMIKAGSFSIPSRKNSVMAASFLQQQLAEENRARLRQLINAQQNPGPSRRDRARIRRIRAQKFYSLVLLLSWTRRVGDKLQTVRDENALFLLRYMSVCKIQKTFRKYRKRKREAQVTLSSIVLRRFVRVLAVRFKMGRQKRAANILRNFLTDYTKNDVKNLIRRYKSKIIRGQRCWRQYMQISRARLQLLSLQWAKVEEKIRRKEMERQEVAKAQLLAAELELMKDTRIGKSGSVKTLTTRVKDVLATSQLHQEKMQVITDTLKTDSKVKMQILTALLREKRLAYQDTVQDVTNRLLAKRQTVSKLTREDVRRFIRSSAGTKFQISETQAEAALPSGLRVFLLLSSLEPGELRLLVEKGIKMTHGEAGALSLSQLRKQEESIGGERQDGLSAPQNSSK